MFRGGGAIDLALLRIHNAFESISMELCLTDIGDEGLSQYRMGAGSRQSSGDFHCMKAVVIKSLGNTRNQFILWEVVEYLAQDGEQMMCLHAHKGSDRQNFVPWTVHI